jgi:predicted DNA-binding protein (UPF0251 family)
VSHWHYYEQPVKIANMPNRRRFRHIKMPPSMEGYKPFGIPMRELESVDLLFEEYEALRLADYEDLTQEEAAKKMNISRPTFTRLYDKARKNIAKAFVEGKAIIIRGGTYVTDNYWYKCGDCNQTTISDHPVSRCRECNSDNITQINNQSETDK